jgi:hypothetical protein
MRTFSLYKLFRAGRNTAGRGAQSASSGQLPQDVLFLAAPRSRILKILLALALVLLATPAAAPGDDGNKCPACFKMSFWCNLPLGLHGRNPDAIPACGTQVSCCPRGPYFGYYPTCWHRWPDGWPLCCNSPGNDHLMLTPTMDTLPNYNPVPTPAKRTSANDEAPRSALPSVVARAGSAPPVESTVLAPLPKSVDRASAVEVRLAKAPMAKPAALAKVKPAGPTLQQPAAPTVLKPTILKPATAVVEDRGPLPVLQYPTGTQTGGVKFLPPPPIDTPAVP